MSSMQSTIPMHRDWRSSQAAAFGWQSWQASQLSAYFLPTFSDENVIQTAEA